MIKNVNGRFDDYSISPKIRKILLHWGYELGTDIITVVVKKNCWVYISNIDAIKEKAKNKYRNL